MSEPSKAVRVPVNLKEADQGHRRPLNLEMLSQLGEQDVAGATVLHSVGGFRGRGQIKTRTLVAAGGKLPLVLTFMAPNRLIVSEKVALESGEFE